MLAKMTISIMWLPFVVIISAIIGFCFRNIQIRKFRKRVIELENEMLRNHAEILNLQQELMASESKNALPYKSRVVPMIEPQQDGNTENRDSSQRKKIKK